MKDGHASGSRQQTVMRLGGAHLWLLGHRKQVVTSSAAAVPWDVQQRALPWLTQEWSNAEHASP